VRDLSSGPPVDRSSRITLQFHPDRVARGVPVLRALARDGRYRSQFETGTGNGGLTAYVGGDRWRWESRIFGRAYDDAAPAERPKYGALNFRNRSVGAAPRFGSSYLRLTEDCLDRASFCYPDSVFDPADFGVAARLSLPHKETGDPLDDYVEAHVHGQVRLEQDVEALVLDPCYRGTEVEWTAPDLPCPVRWHGGFRLCVTELCAHPEYRGRRIVELGARLAVDGLLDARILGQAVRDGYDGQDVKLVWHYVARFGSRDGD
jgi:hypothetical protein